MRVWTLAPPTDRPFEGESTVDKAGRWHRPGMRIAYTSESLPLALLELLVHLDGGEVPAVHAYALDVPDGGLVRIDPVTLPAGWREDPPPELLCDITARWLADGSAPALAVPSAIVEEAWNVLVNPEHPDWERPLRAAEARPFEIDPRLL